MVLKKSLVGLAAGFGLFSILATTGTAPAQEPEACWPEAVRIENLTGEFYVIYGPGGNIGVSAGEEGVFLIDDQVKPLTDDVLAAIREVSDGEIRFVLNTHWHGDHAGGNENLGRGGAVIVAHDNVRKRLSEPFTRSDGRTYNAQPPAALPVITFNDQASIFLNGEKGRAIHVPHAHTDGDSAVYFKDANLLHAGDLFFNTCYPFVDLESGGSIQGLMSALDILLATADEETVLIPGHGPVTDKAGLQAYADMLNAITERIAALKADGKTLDEIQEAKPTAEFDSDWAWGFINGEAITGVIYNSLSEED